MKKEIILRTRVQRTFSEQVSSEAKRIGLNASEYLRLALIEKIARDSKQG